MRKDKIDMTTGNPLYRILVFSVPLVFSNLLQQLYSLTDSVIVGRYAGLNALASIGGTGWVRWALLGVCTDCAIGFGIAASQRIGAGDQRGFRKIIAAAIEFGCAGGILLTLIFRLLVDDITTALQIEASILPQARLYLSYMVMALPITLLYNLICAILRSNGNSTGPFLSVVFSSGLNVVLDLYLVAYLNKGIQGAAQATVFSQMISLAIVVFLMVRDDSYHIEKKDLTPDYVLFFETVKLWGPLFFNSIVLAVGGVIVDSRVNMQGPAIAAGIAAASRCYSFLETIEKAVCSGVSVYVGQNYGAEKPDRISVGMKYMAAFAFLFSVALAVVLLTLGDPMLRLFIGEAEDPTVAKTALEAAWIYIHVNCIGVFFMVPMHIFRAALQSLGHAGYTLLAACIQLGARCFAAFWLMEWFGLAGLCTDNGLASLICMPVIFIPYFRYMRQELSKKHMRN